MPLPTLTIGEIATQLTDGYWNSTGLAPRHFTSNVIHYNISGLTAAEQLIARQAFQVWDEVCGLSFVEGGAIDITVDDNNPAANTVSQVSGSTILLSTINISTDVTAFYGSGLYNYTYQVYIHEIGHALGLGHAGNYNTTATYGINNYYANDSWAYSVMSYFDQAAAGLGTKAFVTTPQMADIEAVQRLYGVGSAREGNTVYGYASTAGPQYALDDGNPPLTRHNYVTAFTIYDTGGYDTLNATGDIGADVLNLMPGTFSSMHGLINNVSIALGTIIEVAQGGTGNDTITGNDIDNILQGNAGADSIAGGGGYDYIDGGTGFDVLAGGDGNDIILGQAGNDSLYGDAGNDFLYGGLGADSLFGGEGDDNINSSDSEVGDYAYGGVGNDFIYGGAAADTIYGGTNYDNIQGGFGDDLVFGGDDIDFVYGESGVDTLFGGLGMDFLYGGGDDDTVVGDDGVDFLYGDVGADRIFGGADGDYMWGGFGSDFFYAGDGNDFILSVGEIDGDSGTGDAGDDYFILGDGNDFAFGGLGTDVVIAGGGDDRMDGGLGQDYLWGGAGADLFELTNGSGTEVVYDFVQGTDRIRVVSTMYASFAAVNAGHIGYDASSNTTVVFSADSSTLILLLNTNAASLNAASFSFV
jgi:serralysin